jgi:hypothetical protein
MAEAVAADSARPEPSARDRDAGRGFGGLSRLLTLLGLTGLAVSQPLLSALGEQPTVFTFNRVEGLALVAFAIVVAVVPPLVLWGLGSLAMWLNAVAGRVVHLCFVAVLVAMTASQLLRWTFDFRQPVLVTVLATASGAAGAWAFARSVHLRDATRYVAVLPAVAVALFLFSSETAPLLSTGSEKDTTAESATEVSPVVVLLLDEFPTKSLLATDGGVDTERFPNLAAFAEDATWYRNYTTSATSTEIAVPSMLSGQLPVDEPPLFTSYPDNLFSLLEPTHELSVFESFTKLCSLAECEDTGEQDPSWGDLATTTLDLFRARIDPTAERRASTMADFEEQTADGPVPPATTGTDNLEIARGITTAKGYPVRFRQFLESITETRAPTLHFMHLVLPHQPWRYYPGGTFASTPVGIGAAHYPFSSTNDSGNWVATLSEQRHLLQAQYTDALVGQMMERLRATDRYDESMIVIVSDHGYSFESGTQVRNLEQASLDSLAYAPLFVKLPGQDEGRIDDSNVTATDLLPTIADGAGVEIPFPVEGLPADDERIALRDDTKQITDVIQSIGGTKFNGEMKFTIEETAPRAGDRWIPPLPSDVDDLWALHRAAGIEDQVGRPLDELVTGASGTATVDQLADHERPPADPPGIVTGRVTDGAGQGTILVAMNGTVVAGSPLFTFAGEPGTFATLTPEDWVGRPKTVRLALLTNEGITELAVE